MKPAIRPYNQPLLPNQELVKQAQSFLHQLPQREHARYSLIDRTTGKVLDMDLPDEVFDMVVEILTAIARNQVVNLVPTNHELTTNQTADFLNVSRGFVISLIDKGLLKHHMVGTHRRLRFEDVLAFREKMLKDASSALNTMSEIEKELDLGL